MQKKLHDIQRKLRVVDNDENRLGRLHLQPSVPRVRRGRLSDPLQRPSHRGGCSGANLF